MNIVDTFFNELQKHINSGDDSINIFENHKNEILELKNILYKYEIVDMNIDVDTLIAFDDEDLSRIFNIIDEEKSTFLFKTYLTYKPLVEMYNKIKEKYNGNFEAPQYNECIKWFNNIIDKIKAFLSNDSKDGNEYIDSLKEQKKYYKKYYNMFSNNKLIEPISDFEEFNNLLDSLNFDDLSKGKIKKFIGISNIMLFKNEDDGLNSASYDKYKTILENKKEKYNDLYQEFKKQDFDEINNELVKELSSKFSADESDVRQALCVILIEKIFNEINNNEVNKEDAIVKLENAIDFSHEVIEEETEKAKVITKEDILINEVKEILDSEKELIDSMSEKDFKIHLADSINSDSKEMVKYQIVSVLIALHAELQKYYNVLDIRSAKNMTISNIREYLETYKILKARSENN